MSCHFQRVNFCSGGENVGEVAERVSFVVIDDGVAKINGVGGVFFERVKEIDGDFSAGGFDFRHFNLRRRDDDFLLCIFHLDYFIKFNGDFLCFFSLCTKRRSHSYDAGRRFIVGSTVRP